ncbi:MAG: Gfo/Idh/MocA family protein [Pikeienuella sp.]
MARVRWGIIGAGDVVRRKSGPSLLAEPRSSLAAICSGGSDVSALTARFGARLHPNAKSLIADRAIDAIYIAVPPQHHEEMVMQALAARKPIVVEKPIAPDLAGGMRMVAAARTERTSLSVAYYRRCDPKLTRMLAMVEAGAVGKLEKVEIRQLRTDGDVPPYGWRGDPSASPGGRFSDSHSHALDWLIWAFGPVNKHSVVARGSAVAYALSLDECTATGVFDPDADEAEDRLTIHGEKGTLTTKFFDPGPLRLTRDGGMIEQDIATPAAPHLPFFAAMVEHILDDANSPCTAIDALAASRIIEAIYPPGV